MDPYIGEIRMFGGNFAPVGWVFCNGQMLPIAQYDVLFNLIGTTYGGDGQSTFGVPDLRGRVPVHTGNGFQMGQQAGTESVTLTVNQLPTHNHTLQFSTAVGTQTSPVGNVPAKFAGTNIYVDSPATGPLANGSLSTDGGGGQPHENRQPFLCISFIIATAGVYPTPS